MKELSKNEISDVNGSGGSCLAMVNATTIMGAAIGGVGGGILGAGVGAGPGAWWGAGFGGSMGLSLCGALKLK